MKRYKKFLRQTVILIFCLLIVALFLSGCGGSSQDRAQGPIIILGLDGIEWDFVLPMIKKGRLPNIVKLMKRGYYGELETFAPALSPSIWTSIVTGKVVKKHGISGFFRRFSGSGKITLIKSTDRKTKALWNILSDYNKSVWSVGWWITFPVEKINGIMVSQTNALPQLDTPRGRNEKIWKGTLLKGVNGQVYPPRRQNEMITILNEVDEDLPALLKRIFGEFRFPLSQLGQRLWDNCRWAFRADTTYYRILGKLVKEDPLPDLTLLYFGGTDVVGHRFLRYMHPELYKHKPTKEQITNFGTIIEDYYAYCDRILEELLEIYGPDATFFVISDHGMDPINLDAEFNPDAPWNANTSGGHKDNPPAFFLAAGPHIRKLPMNKPLQNLTRQDLEKVCTVFDITPTILAMLRIPIGKDMDGKVVKKIFRDEFPIDIQPPPVPTHDTPEFLTNQKKRKKQKFISPEEKERLEQLRSLGYIDD
jgi:predicted AlkP superfamily pyrophosphatase or phosphodiesterase